MDFKNILMILIIKLKKFILRDIGMFFNKIYLKGLMERNIKEDLNMRILHLILEIILIIRNMDKEN